MIKAGGGKDGGEGGDDGGGRWATGGQGPRAVDMAAKRKAQLEIRICTA